jgi:hypothetical protein
MKALLLLSAATALSVAGRSNAQVKVARPDSGCTTSADGSVECRIYRSSGDSGARRFYYRTDSAMAKRAALGIEVRTTGTRRDTLGVFVDAVTPKGPAEAAGIVEGDRIAAINGVDLRTTAADTEDSYTNALAAHRLTREMQKLTPGSRVNLRVYSGGRVRDVQVTAGKASELMRFSSRGLIPGMNEMRFEGPDAMMFGPDMPMLRQRLRDLPNDQQLERLRELPNRIQLRTPMRIKTLSPSRVRAPRVYKVDRGPDATWTASDTPEVISIGGDELEFDDSDLFEFDEPFSFELEEPFDVLDDIEFVSPETIRDLASTTIRDARVALAQLAAARIV